MDVIERRPAVGAYGPHEQHVEVHPGYAVVPRRSPGPGKTGTLSPEHAFDTRAPLIDAGDPFNTRNIVHYGDFYMQGKPWSDPGINVNMYSAIPYLNGIMQPFFGFVSKLRYLRQPSRIVRGRMTPVRDDVNVEPPAVVAYGDFATYTANQRIPTGR